MCCAEDGSARRTTAKAQGPADRLTGWRPVKQTVTAPSTQAPMELSEMGLAPGGRMQQEIYDDPYGLDAWDQRHASRCFVSIVNSQASIAPGGLGRGRAGRR